MTKNTLKIVNTEKTEDKKEKQKALDAAISQIDQNYGKGSVMRPVSYTHLRAHET